MKPSGFGGLRVAAFESRMADEMTRLIQRYGGRPLVAPSMREVPLAHNTEVLTFGERLLAGTFDMLILLTGVGTRTMIEVLETRFPRDAILEALRRLELVARGPKPVNALREYGLSPQVTVPEPNTWRETLAALEDSKKSLRGTRIAVQEYGVPNPELQAGLQERGAQVLTVPVYRWALPEDLTPLLRVIEAIQQGQVDVVLVTNAAQVEHVMQVMQEKMPGESNGTRFRRALARMVVGSIGPTASERLRAHGWPVDLEPSHPKMGVLVKETAERAPFLLTKKRGAKG
jgi:uroporphyrinogen-III synthase